MNFLQLCVRVREEAGVSGSGPTTVLNQNGQLQRIVGWVDKAWNDIQLMRPNWEFMHGDFSFSTTIDQRDYVAGDESITDLKLWDLESFLMYDPAIGETDQAEIPYIDYSNWRSTYRVQMNARASGRPVAITRLQDNSIRFEPKPDKVYTIEGEYKKSTQAFTADADTPTNLPDDFHMIIVWQALKSYGFYENAPEVLDEAEVNFDNLLFRLEQEQLPTFSEAREPLA